MISGLVDHWRRSVQTRVVVGTIALSALVVTVTGLWLLGRVTDGLLESQTSSAVAEARAGYAYAARHLDASVARDDSPRVEDVNDLLTSLIGRGGAERAFDIVVVGPLDESDMADPLRSSADRATAAVTDEITAEVEGSRGTYWTYVALEDTGGETPGLVVGSQVHVPRSGDTYAMYYVFSLADVQSAIDLVQRALIVGGLGMVLLVGGVAWFMSRQVLAPVRLARRAAERYADGRLEQRMHVKGDDDIARLNASFNQMAANLQAQIRQLEELSRLQRQFVADVSHELRTPLTTVSMAAEMLHERRDDFDPSARRAAELLESEIDHFANLLNDLLEMSRFDSDAAVLHHGEVDLGALVCDFVESLAVQSAVRQADTSIEVDGPAGVVLEADQRRLERIVRNLVGNAIRYSGSDRIEVRWAQSETAVALGVRDYGIGLSEEAVRRVFHRFWRADPARSRGGTGLGLSIAREDARLHGGTLRVWSQPDRGSHFVLTLPRTAGTPVGDEPIPVEPEGVT